jgi:SAM-dependent methyltransferase
MKFKDHFSGHAGIYAQHRPTYPDSLYEAICEHVPNRQLAWDCGTGNGQVAVHLAEYFEKVLASDASANQIEHAIAHPKVEYHVCRAEETPFDDRSFDLVTVGQAIHWFDFEPFFAELRRVTKPGGIFACWSYRYLTINAELDAVLEKFFALIEPYWPPERDHVESRYKTIPFPPYLSEIVIQDGIHIEREMPAESVLNYLRTWSSVKNYKKEHHGKDPLASIEAEFQDRWGGRDRLRLVTHPMLIKVFRVG